MKYIYDDVKVTEIKPSRFPRHEGSADERHTKFVEKICDLDEDLMENILTVKNRQSRK